MGNSDSSAVNIQGSSTLPLSYDDNTPTPKLSLMKLKGGRKSHPAASKFKPNGYVGPPSQITKGSPSKVVNDTHPANARVTQTRTCMDLGSGQNTYLRASFHMLEKAHMDNPCESDEEEEVPKEYDVKPREDELELISAPFAVSHYTQPEIERKMTASDAKELKVIKCTQIKDDIPEPKRKKAAQTRKALMAALFDVGRCAFCGKGLEPKTNFMEAPCGHKFHSGCIEDRQKCPQCGEIIEKGFTI